MRSFSQRDGDVEKKFFYCLGGVRVFRHEHVEYPGVDFSSTRFVPSDDAEELADALQ